MAKKRLSHLDDSHHVGHGFGTTAGPVSVGGQGESMTHRSGPHRHARTFRKTLPTSSP